jgi:hypothetical protein
MFRAQRLVLGLGPSSEALQVKPLAERQTAVRLYFVANVHHHVRVRFAARFFYHQVTKRRVRVRARAPKPPDNGFEASCGNPSGGKLGCRPAAPPCPPSWSTLKAGHSNASGRTREERQYFC